MRRLIAPLVILAIGVVLLSFSWQGDPVSDAIDKGLDFLCENQLDYGEFETYACPATGDECYFDSSPFVTGLIAYSLSEVKEKRVDEMVNKATGFLLEEQENGLWSYWSSKNPLYGLLDQDLDDTSVASLALKTAGVEFEDNMETILNNKNGAGVFLTWVKGGYNDVDCVVNTNVLAYLGHDDPKVCKYLNDALVQNLSCAHYYPNRLAFFYAAGKAFKNGAGCLGESKQIIIESIQKSEFISELETALALNALMDFGYYGVEVDIGIQSLIKNQTAEGSWEASVFHSTIDFSYYSEELVTALAIEALWKYQARMK